MSTPASKLTAEILIEIPKCFPNIRCWRNNRIDVLAVGRGGRLRKVSAGVDGQGDISGIIGPSGKRLEIEVKYGKDKQSGDQIAFQDMIERHGGVYIVARSVAGCLQLLGMSGGSDGR